jgi:iron complex outermembrane receptor protein
LRYGGKIGEQAHYRIYAKYDDYDDLTDPSGDDAGDPWRKLQGGFRADWEPFAGSTLTLQSDVHTAEVNGTAHLTSLTPPHIRDFSSDEEVFGANVLGRWTHSFSGESQVSLQAFYDHASRNDLDLSLVRDTFDVEFQHRLALGARNNLIYGAGYRHTKFDYEDSFFLDIDDGEERMATDTFNVFVQDEITLLKDRLSLTLGSKFEHNAFSGFEVQPSGRLLWTPDERNSVWGSVARAVRTPNPSETRLRINHTVFDTDGPGPRPPTVLSIFPEHDLESETLIAYELGYRVQPRKDLFLDIAAFYNVYDDLIVDAPTGAFMEFTPPPPHLTIASREAPSRYSPSTSGASTISGPLS